MLQSCPRKVFGFLSTAVFIGQRRYAEFGAAGGQTKRHGTDFDTENSSRWCTTIRDTRSTIDAQTCTTGETKSVASDRAWLLVSHIAPKTAPATAPAPAPAPAPILVCSSWETSGHHHHHRRHTRSLRKTSRQQQHGQRNVES